MTGEQIDALAGAGARRTTGLVTKRRLVFALAVLAAVLVPLAALGAANSWWFLKNGGAPVPTKEPQVVKEGQWDGRPWQLIAYPSATHGLCVSVTPKDSGNTGEGGAASCGPFVGFAFLVGGGSEKLPAYIAGAVIEKASMVEVRFGDGDALRIPTFAGSEPLQHVRFYAAQLRAGILFTPGTAPSLKWVAGLDASGNVVACLAPQTIAKDGVSALSDCR